MKQNTKVEFEDGFRIEKIYVTGDNGLHSHTNVKLVHHESSRGITMTVREPGILHSSIEEWKQRILAGEGEVDPKWAHEEMLEEMS